MFPLFKYNSLQSVSTERKVNHRRELREMAVLNTGAEGHPFNSRFPFSWEIMYLLDDTLRSHADDNGIEGKQDYIVLNTYYVYLRSPRHRRYLFIFASERI